ncbi:hypothetical protein [Pseudomonas atacamensis]|uniref:hypothetical protein n=1 Tax=Pseudomonas atacamensis TaxID=2565368 RepID=UPI0019D0133D|nr:hypothetical protein [Pseudomonas atacamensis]QSL90511.1 hypothetical protein JWU58_27110 [Pseudomonas atacamensis]
MPNPPFQHQQASRHEYAVHVAQLVLTQWYVTWDSWRNHSDPVLRGLALFSKVNGLICHDHALIRAKSNIRRWNHGRPFA